MGTESIRITPIPFSIIALSRVKTKKLPMPAPIPENIAKNSPSFHFTSPSWLNFIIVRILEAPEKRFVAIAWAGGKPIKRSMGIIIDPPPPTSVLHIRTKRVIKKTITISVVIY